VSLDMPLEGISKNLLIRFDSRVCITVIAPDPNVSAENRSLRRGTSDLKSIAKPAAMRATIGIDEGNDITPRKPNSNIARRAGSRL